MTAAIYSLHYAYFGRYTVAVQSPWPEIFEHNPHVVPAQPGMVEIAMRYPAISQSNDRAIHFMQAWCEHLSDTLGIRIPLATNRPRLYFDSPEPEQEDYWLLCSGIKNDFTAKLWGHHNYQAVVSLLKGSVAFVQVGRKEDDHPRIDGTVDMVGKTSLRDLFNLARRAKGILCGVSLLMHVAAALQKPSVVIAGGREPVAWNAYSRQQYVHTVGTLPCRSVQGHMGEACWRSRVVPLSDDNHGFNRDTCHYPVSANGQVVPACMDLIRPETVAELVLRYNVKQEEKHDNSAYSAE